MIKFMIKNGADKSITNKGKTAWDMAKQQKTKDYLEGAGSCTPRGEVELKNKGSWSTYFLDGLN